MIFSGSLRYFFVENKGNGVIGGHSLAGIHITGSGYDKYNEARYQKDKTGHKGE